MFSFLSLDVLIFVVRSLCTSFSWEAHDSLAFYLSSTNSPNVHCFLEITDNGFPYFQIIFLPYNLIETSWKIKMV